MRLGFSAGLALALSGLAAGTAGAANDFRDVAVISVTIQQVLEFEPSGRPVSWSNPETGHSGSVTAERTYYIDDRRPCREYTRTMTDGSGSVMIVSGTGCRDAAGRWKLDEEATARPAPPSVPEPVEVRREPEPPREPVFEPRYTATEPPAAPEPEAAPPSASTAARRPVSPPQATEPPTPLRRPESEAAAEAAPVAAPTSPAPPTLSVSLPTRSEG